MENTKLNKTKLIESLTKHEGLRTLPYEDSVGVLTIGIGHNLEDRPLTNRAVLTILEDDIAEAAHELKRLKNYINFDKTLSDERENVLIELMFNLGSPRLSKFVKFWAAMKDADYEAASIEMLDSKWARQVGQRAKTLAEQMRTGEFQ